MDQFLHINFKDKAKFEKWVGGLSDENKKKASHTIVNAVSRMERRAKYFAPKDDGFLRSSIYSEFGRATFGQVLGGAVYTTKLYAPYAEWGTGTYAGRYLGSRPQEEKDYASNWWTRKQHRGMRGTPYLMPAYYMAIKEVEMQLKDMGFEKK